MSEHWRMLARNYAKFDTPLRPHADTFTAIKALSRGADPLVIVLGGTPLFAGLARRVWFVDVAQDALQLAQPGAQQRTIQKNWLAAAEEFAQADLIVGDAAINALDSPAAAQQLLAVLAKSLKPHATLAMRVFVKHELSTPDVQQRLVRAFENQRYSEMRFLVYGLITGADGIASVNAIDQFVDDLHAHLPIDRAVCERYKAEHFAWRGMSATAAAAITTQSFFPARAQIEALLMDAGLGVATVNAGNFPLAEFTPIYVARR